MNIEQIADLMLLSEAIEILTGPYTESLWVPIEDLPVKDIEGNVVGYFYFDEDTENFGFRTVE